MSENGTNGKSPPLLDLDELSTPAGQFRIGGETYDFIHFDALGIIAQRQIATKWQHVDGLTKEKKPTVKQEAEYERQVRLLIQKVSDMPAPAAASAEVEKLYRALVCFFSFRSASQVTLAMRIAAIAGNQSTGANSSPVSTQGGRRKKARG